MADSDVRERPDQDIDSDRLRDITGISPAEERAIEARAKSDSDDTIGKGFQANPKKKARFTRRQKIAGGGLTGILIGGGIGLFTVISGPLQLIHLSQVLGKNLNPNSLTAQKRFPKMHKFFTAQSAEETNLTFTGRLVYRKVAARLKSQGINISSRYGLINIEIDINKLYPDLAGETTLNKRVVAAERLGLDDPAKLKANKAGSTTATYSIDATRATSVEAGRVVEIGLGEDRGRVLSALEKRSIFKAHGIPSRFRIFKRATYKLNQLEARWMIKAQKKYNKWRASREPSRFTTAAKSAREKLNAFGESKTARVLGRISLGIDLLCILNDTASAIPVVNWGYVVVPSMLEALDTTGAGNEIMAAGIMGRNSEVSLEEVGVRISGLKDEQGRSVWEGKALNALANNDDGKGEDLSNDYKQAFSPKTTEEMLRGILGGTFAGIYDGVVDVACSTAGRATSLVAGLVLTVSTAGSWSFVTAGKELGKMVLLGGFLSLASSKTIDYFSEEPAKVFSGPVGGNLLAYGMRAANNASARMSGGVELSDQEEALVVRELRNQEIKEFQKRSVFVRLFDLKDYRSMSSIALREIPTNYQQLSTNFANALLNPLKIMGSALSRIFTVRAAGAYEYSFPLYGIPSSVLNDPSVEDPIENAKAAAGIFDSGNYIDKAKICFGVKIFKGAHGWDVEQEDDVNPADKNYADANCSDTNSDWKKVMMFVYDSKLISSMACYESVDENECSKIGFGTSASSTQPSGGIGQADGLVFPLQTTKATVQNNNPKWCYDKPVNCHHDYNAADIFAPTGTVVLAAKSGTIIKVAFTAGSGHRVQIKGDDGNIYFYNHMLENSPIEAGVTDGARIEAGKPIGKIGTDTDAQSTPKHLHIDALPPPYTGRVSCKGSACSGIPFINLQPALIKAYNNLPL